MDGVHIYTGVPATLTEQGAQGFAGFYPAGTVLDPLTITIAEPGAALPPAGSPGARQGGVKPASLAQTGAGLWPYLLTGATLLVLGTALLLGRVMIARWDISGSCTKACTVTKIAGGI